MKTQRGFTLIEIVMVIIIMAVTSVPIFGLFSQAGVTALSNGTIQTAIQLAQERAEHLIAVRRNQHYTAVDISVGQVENLTGSYAGFTRTTTIDSAYTGSDCPAVTCKQVTVGVTESGQTHAEITFILVNY